MNKHFDEMMWEHREPKAKRYYEHLSNITTTQIGRDCIIHSHVWIGDAVRIGMACKIQAFAFIPNGVVIGDNVFIGPHVCFTNDKNPPHDDYKETVVESGVAIGANATILPGIVLHKNCKIGAGAVVTKSVPEGEMWVGNPARKI